MLDNTIHITVREDLSEELHLNSEEGMPVYVGAEASVTRIENGVTIRLKDYKGETIETVYEAIESIDFDDGIMTITLPDGRTFTSDDLTGPQGLQGPQGVPGSDGVDGQDGQDGHSPVVTASKSGKVTTVSVDGVAIATINDGADGSDGQDGSDGEDGFSPVVGITDISGGHRISITDEVDTYTADVMDGVDGQDGTDGQDGQDGVDGYSPSATVTKSGTVATITITDKDGTTTAEVYDGSGSISDVMVDGTSVVTGGIAEIDLTGKADVSSLAPVATSGSYTELDDKPTIPTKTSDLTNDSGYITGYTETDPTVPSWAKASSKPSYTASEVGALPDTTVIPTKVSELQNDSGFITSAEDAYVLVVSKSSVSSLPTEISNGNITTDHVCPPGNMYLSNPSAQTGEWTINTNTAGKAVISGSISGTTDITLYLERSR